MTERYLNDRLDSATKILSPGSFLTTHASSSVTLLLYLCFYGLCCTVLRASVMFTQRRCYVMLRVYDVRGLEGNAPFRH